VINEKLASLSIFSRDRAITAPLTTIFSSGIGFNLGTEGFRFGGGEIMVSSLQFLDVLHIHASWCFG